MTTRVVVYHGSYGCDTGCCGHWIEVDGLDPTLYPKQEFTFSHPDVPTEEGYKAFAKELVTDLLGAEHVADLVWDECIINYD